MFQLLAKNIKPILIWGLGLAAVSLVVSFLIPKYYRAEGAVLIISRDKGAAYQYNQARAVEQTGKNLIQIMRTQDFIDKVLSSGYDFDRSRWNIADQLSLRQEWRKSVCGKAVRGTGILKISAYGKNKDDAKNFAAAVVQTLADRGWEYTGADVSLKVVDAPVVLPWQTGPNIIEGAIIGFIAGVILSAVFILWKKKNRPINSA